MCKTVAVVVMYARADGKQVDQNSKHKSNPMFRPTTRHGVLNPSTWNKK
jgi:hypothetical protein